MKRPVPGAVQTKGMGMTTIETAKIIGVLFVIIHLFISVGIVQDGDLATIEHKDAFLIHMNSNRLVKTSGVSLPGYLA